ncbi:MAG: hypothetical protein ABIN94_17030 [Ferruginibacter sp.]
MSHQMSHPKTHEHHLRFFKIAAQTTGVIACLFILLVLAGKGVPSVLSHDADELIPFAPFLFLGAAGLIITWYHELAGTLIITVAGVILLGFFKLRGDMGAGLIYGVPFIVTAAVFYLHISKREIFRKKREQEITA